MSDNRPQPIARVRDYLAGDGLEEADLSKANVFLREALTRHKAEGLLFAVRARWIALLIIGIYLPVLNFAWEMIYYEILLLGFAAIGWAQLRIGQVGRSGPELRLLFADIVLLTFTFLAPNPFAAEKIPTAMQYSFNNFYYFYIFLAAATMAYSWRTTVAFGSWVSGLWIVGAILVYFFGFRIPELSIAVEQAFGGDQRLIEIYDPNSVRFTARVQEILVFLITAWILAINGARTTALITKQAAYARERANLARHFPPNIVEQMASQDEPLGPVRAQQVVVMFADIVGFTRMAEGQEPQETMTFLRDFHNVMEDAIFRDHGTLDKFLGDGIMATFGTPETTPEDATNALRCAKNMLVGIDAWNEVRIEQGQEPIRLSIGLHYGNVVLGDIGSERLLEFAVIGDAVNVASRLETMTRELGIRLIVSDALIEALLPESRDELTKDLVEHAPLKLRGRDDPVKSWVLE